MLFAVVNENSLLHRHLLQRSKALRMTYLVKAQGLVCVDLWLTYVNHSK